MDTVESLARKIEGAKDIKSVVKTMKAVAASKIGQYELAVGSLGDYYHTVALGIIGYFKAEKINTLTVEKVKKKKKEKLTCAIVFGSDQGLVGQFNDSLADFVFKSLNAFPGKKEVWAVGERIKPILSDGALEITKLFSVPDSVNAITPLVRQILVKSEESHEKEDMKDFYIFHNRPKTGAVYEPVMQRLLPLDEEWRKSVQELKWPTKLLPQVAGGIKPTLMALIKEYLFVSLFKACAESLTSENASRLNAMTRAEKNIGEMLDTLHNQYHRLRQSSIDEELFDVVSGFEALKVDKSKNS